MLFAELARTSAVVASTSKRTEKVAAFAAVFARLAPGEVAPAVAFAAGEPLQGRLGIGWATLRDVRPTPAAAPVLTIGAVHRAIDELGSISGRGSVARRRDRLDRLLVDATESEQAMLRSIIGGELRQGALDGVVAAAVARAAGVKVGEVRRAAMFTGSLPAAAEVALTEGAAGLAVVELRPATPVQPMLASPAADIDDALDGLGSASVEWKLDGARIQAHRASGDVRLFTRNLNDVTDRLGGVVEVVRSLPGADLILDGEVLGIDPDGVPRRFQDTMGDFGAGAAAGIDAPSGGGVGRGDHLQAFFFDLLHFGSSLVDEPLATRRDRLVATVPEASRLPAMITVDRREAAAFFDRAIAAGHEGVMVKDLASTYTAGRRGAAWRKVKPVHTLDLVVLAAEWGHGRRRGRLSNLHLGARRDDGFVMVGKTFKGLTDALLEWQTGRLLELEFGRGSGREAHVVHVRPELVVEIAVDGVQASSRYPGGVALRFARVRRYRDDKSASEADHVDQVLRLLDTAPGR